MIQIEHLHKKYLSKQGDVIALEDISLNIPQGSVFGIIGLSGAGKSTLIRCLNLLEKPTAGKISMGNRDITKLSGQKLRATRQKIGMIFQHFSLLELRTVSANVAFPLEIAGWPKTALQERVTELLKLVGLSDKAHAYPKQLSGGQKQRIGIARALATYPQVLLCDEATSALDPQTTLSILNLLKQINQDLGLTIVLITHEMNVIKEICTHVAVLEQARIVEQGPVESVFLQPQSATAREFVSSILPNELPTEILEAIKARKNSEIIRLHFRGPQASEPILSNLIRACGVQANILSGNIDHLRSTLFGTLILELQGSPEQLAEAHAYLATCELATEVLHHAS